MDEVILSFNPIYFTIWMSEPWNVFSVYYHPYYFHIEKQKYCLRTKKYCSSRKIHFKSFFGGCHITPVFSSSHWRFFVFLKPIGHFQFLPPINLPGSLYFTETCPLSPLIFVPVFHFLCSLSSSMSERICHSKFLNIFIYQCLFPCHMYSSVIQWFENFPFCLSYFIVCFSSSNY